MGQPDARFEPRRLGPDSVIPSRKTLYAQILYQDDSVLGGPTEKSEKRPGLMAGLVKVSAIQVVIRARKTGPLLPWRPGYHLPVNTPRSVGEGAKRPIWLRRQWLLTRLRLSPRWSTPLQWGGWKQLLAKKRVN